MKRVLKMLSCLCALLLLLPLCAVGEELTQLYLEHSDHNDYTTYMAAIGTPAAVAEPVVLYDEQDGLSLAEGEQLTFTVERRTVRTPVATGTMLDNQIGLVKIANFNSHCADETIAAVEALLEQGAKALIFDVRFNGGG